MGGEVRRARPGDPLVMGQRGKGGCSRCSATELTQPCMGGVQGSSCIMFADITLDKESHDPVRLLGSQSCIAVMCTWVGKYMVFFFSVF